MRQRTSIKEIVGLNLRDRACIESACSGATTATPAVPELSSSNGAASIVRVLIRQGAVTVLDVRPPDEFALGHVPGAVNIRLRTLKERLVEINPDREIVAYCRGEYCVLSFEAVALLRARGFKARRLEEGLPEWRAAGLRIKALVEPKS